MYALQQGNKRSKGCLYFIITILKDHEANYNVLGEKWIRKQVYGVSDIFIIIIRKIPKLLKVSSQTKQTIWCFFQSPSETSAYLHGTLLQRTLLRWRFFLCILCKLVWVRLSLGIIKNFNKMPRLDRRNDTQIH